MDVSPLAGAVAVPAGQTLALDIASAQSDVSFQVLYDSASKPSRIVLPTTTVIRMDSLAVYDAPYPGGSPVVNAANGDTLYVHAAASDPFGAYDIAGLDLVIDATGTVGDVTTTLTDAHVVASNAASKTYEYVWNTGLPEGPYTITATAREGYENAVTDAKSTLVTLNFLDVGTPSTTEFTTGTNGPHTLTYETNETVCVRVVDVDQNLDPLNVETVTVTVVGSDGDTETVTLTETGPSTGIFAGGIPASSTLAGASQDGTLYALPGAVLTVVYVDPNDPSDTGNDTATVPAPPGVTSLSLLKALTAPADGQATVGEPLQFLLRVFNSGSTTQNTVSVTDTFPAANLGYVSASPVPDSVGAGSLTWNNLGPLLPGQSVDLLVDFTALASAHPATNAALADNGGGVTATGTATVVVTQPALTLVKTLLSPNPGPANKGENVRFLIVASNAGDTVIASLPLEDTYSGALFGFVSATPPPDSTAYGSLLWTNLAGAGLAPGAATNVEIVLEALGAGNPALNSAAADYTSDIYGDPVAPVNSSTGLQILAATISGFVLDDVNTNGFGGDAPLDGVSVSLFTDPNGDGDPADGSLVGLAVTSTNGYYEFLNLGTGAYVVVETDPLGYRSVADTAGANDNRIPVSVVALADYPDNNFLDEVIPPVSYGAILGQVRFDVDGDGDLLDADSGIAGVTIDLYTDPNGDGDPADGVLLSSTLTAGAGSTGVYSFVSLPPGAYVLLETDPAGYFSTADKMGANDNRIAVNLAPNSTNSANDFLDSANAVVTGHLYVDVNGNGQQDTGEPNLSNVTVVVTSGTNAVFAASDANGDWTAAVPPGSVTSKVDTADADFLAQVPGAYVQTEGDDPSVVFAPAGQTTDAGNDGYFSPGALGDFVWRDTNLNGQQDPGEPGLPGVVVTLYDSQTNVVGVATSAVDGAYGFAGVAPGTYRIAFAPPPGYVLTLADTGSDLSDSDASPVDGLTAAIALSASETNLTTDAGLFDALPGVSVVKTAGAAADGVPLLVTNGADVVYTYRVVNTGNTYLADLTLTDNVLSAIGTIPGPVAPGATNFFYATNLNVAADITNVATAAGTPAYANGASIPGLPTATDEDDAVVDLIAPAIAVDKTVNGVEFAQGTNGAPVTYAIVVSNTGDVALSNVTATDAALGLTTNLGVLAAGQSATVTVQSVIGADLTNTVSVTGLDPNGDPWTDADDAVVDLIAPAIVVDKTVNGVEYVQGTNGAPVTYAIVVSNTGDVALSNVTAVDAALGLSTNLGILAAGQSATVTVQSVIGADLTNTVSVTGLDPNGDPWTDADDAVVDLIAPDLRLLKTLLSPTGRPAGLGETVQFAIDIANTGDIAVASLIVSDRYDTNYLAYAGATPPPADPADDGWLVWTNIGPLPLGASTTLVVNFTAVGSTAGQPATNAATAAATTPSGRAQAAEAVYSVVTVGCASSKELVSPTGGVANVGEEIVFAIRVTNTGEVALVTVPLEDRYQTNYLAFQSATPAPDDTLDDGALNWANLGPLAPGEAVTLTARFTAVSSSLGQPLTNVVVASPSAGALQPPIAALTNAAPYTIVRADFDPYKELIEPTNRPAVVGEVLTFLISVTNTGDVAFDDLSVTDVYDTNYLGYVEAVPAPDDAMDDGLLTWSSLGPLAAGDSTTLVVRLRATDLTSGGRTNLALVTAQTPAGMPALRTTTNAAPYSIQYGWIGDTVWLDTNLDGQPNENLAQNGINGVRVRLYRIESGSPVYLAQTTTVSSAGRRGYFRFDGLTFGDYRVAVDLGTVPPNLTLPTTLTTIDASLAADGYFADADFGFNTANPTAIGLLYFRGARRGDAVLLEWATAAERHNLGYHLYRAEGDDAPPVRITAALIEGSGTGEGRAYQWLDDAVAPQGVYRYWLEDVAANGATTRHGPVTVRMRAASAPPLPLGLATGPVCIVRAAALARAGLPVHGTDADRIAVWIGEEPVAIYSTAAGRPMSESDFLLFSTENLPATNVTIRVGDGPGVRMTEVNVTPEAAESDLWLWQAQAPQTVRFETSPEQRRYWLRGLTDDTVWLLDVTDARRPRMLVGAEWLAIDGELGVHLGNPAETPARCLGVGASAVIELEPAAPGSAAGSSAETSRP